MRHPLKERLWASLAHVPLITLIWTTYLMYRYYVGTAASNFVMIKNILTISSLPLTPILLTALSIPVSLTIMHLKRRSHLIHDNANEAYHFNIWLFKSYSVTFLVAFIGLYFAWYYIKILAIAIGLCISILCIQQSLFAIKTAFFGSIYRYWYPRRKKQK